MKLLNVLHNAPIIPVEVSCGKRSHIFLRAAIRLSCFDSVKPAFYAVSFYVSTSRGPRPLGIGKRTGRSGKYSPALVLHYFIRVTAYSSLVSRNATQRDQEEFLKNRFSELRNGGHRVYSFVVRLSFLRCFINGNGICCWNLVMEREVIKKNSRKKAVCGMAISIIEFSDGCCKKLRQTLDEACTIRGNQIADVRWPIAWNIEKIYDRCRKLPAFSNPLIRNNGTNTVDIVDVQCKCIRFPFEQNYRSVCERKTFFFFVRLVACAFSRPLVEYKGARQRIYRKHT